MMTCCLGLEFWGPAVASVLQAVKQLEGIKTEGVLQIPPQTSRKPLGNPRIKVDVKAGRRSQDVSSSKRRCCWPFWLQKNCLHTQRRKRCCQRSRRGWSRRQFCPHRRAVNLSPTHRNPRPQNDLPTWIRPCVTPMTPRYTKAFLSMFSLKESWAYHIP